MIAYNTTPTSTASVPPPPTPTSPTISPTRPVSNILIRYLYVSTTYISPYPAVSYSGFQSAGVASATAANIPVIMSEANSCACGGCPLISPTVRISPLTTSTSYRSPGSVQFAATLWEIDAFLALAANNYSAAYIHTREYGVTYNIFDPPPSQNPLESKGWRTGSTYYSLLMMSEVMSKNGSIVTDLNLQNSKTNASSHIAAYGIYDLDNYMDSTSRLADPHENPPR